MMKEADLEKVKHKLGERNLRQHIELIKGQNSEMMKESVTQDQGRD